jgi:hypothetical protein
LIAVVFTVIQLVSNNLPPSSESATITDLRAQLQNVEARLLSYETMRQPPLNVTAPTAAPRGGQ